MRKKTEDKIKDGIIHCAKELLEIKNQKVLEPKHGFDDIKIPEMEGFRIIVLNFQGFKDRRKRNPRGTFKRLKELHKKWNQAHIIIFEESYEYIDFLFQIIVYALQRKYIKENDWVYQKFRAYLRKLSCYQFPEERFKGIQVFKEKEELTQLPRSEKTEENRLRYPKIIESEDSFDQFNRSFNRRFKISSPEDIPGVVLKQSLNYIVNGYFSPHNANSFGVYVRKTVVLTQKTYDLKEEFPTTWRKKYYEPRKENPDRAMRQGIIEAYTKKKHVHKETGRKWLYRELKKGAPLNDIYLNIFT